MGVSKFLAAFGPAMAMISSQLFLAGQNLLSKAVLNNGMSIMAFMTYRHAVAALVVAPLAICKEREKVTKKIPLSVVIWIFLNSLFGITFGIGFFYYGLKETTATYSTVFLSTIPIITYALCILVGLENLELHTRAGRFSIGGTVLCVAGALTFSLHQGKAFHINHHHSPVDSGWNSHHHWLRGTFFLMGCCLSDALWYLVQVKLSTIYASKYWTTTLTCAMGSFQCMIIGLILDRSRTSWRLDFGMQLLTVVYSGVLVTGASFCLNLWTIKSQGAIYPTLFLPLSMIFVTVSEALIFGVPITVGSILGSLAIIIGLYLFVWGRRTKFSSVEDGRNTLMDNLID